MAGAGSKDGRDFSSPNLASVNAQANVEVSSINVPNALVVVWFHCRTEVELSGQTLNSAALSAGWSRLTKKSPVNLFQSKKSSKNQEIMNVSHEISLLVEEIQRLGSKNADGQTSVKFGVLFNDDRCANIFEALVGTLKAAKKKKVISFQGELLLQGVHDNVDIILLQD
ncbi:hypothetical protein Q8A73_018229 [Channa argus]|nr:hypothetical protein Q8A73_018229 [Channa argus]